MLTREMVSTRELPIANELLQELVGSLMCMMGGPVCESLSVA